MGVFHRHSVIFVPYFCDLACLWIIYILINKILLVIIIMFTSCVLIFMSWDPYVLWSHNEGIFCSIYHFIAQTYPANTPVSVVTYSFQLSLHLGGILIQCCPKKCKKKKILWSPQKSNSCHNDKTFLCVCLKHQIL